MVAAAFFFERDAPVIEEAAPRFHFVGSSQALVGDAAYDRRTLLDEAAYLDFTVKVVPGLQGQVPTAADVL